MIRGALYWIEERIRVRRIEHFIAIHHRDEVLCFGEVNDVVRIPRKHVDALDIVARDLEFNHLAFWVVEVALLDEAVATDHDEELPLGVVPVLSLGNARLADVDAHLATIQGMNQLGEGASGIDVHLQREGHFLFWEIREISAVKFLGETAVGDLWNGQGLGLFSETIEKVYYLAQLHKMRDRTVAIWSFLHREHAQAVEVTAVFLALQGGNHLVHQVVDVEQFQLHARVVDGDGQVVGDVVTEGGYRAIVVGTAPLAILHVSLLSARYVRSVERKSLS